MLYFARGSYYSICTDCLVRVSNKLSIPRMLHLNYHPTSHHHSYFTVSDSMVLLLNEPELPARLRL
jgi:hypothetical protein